MRARREDLGFSSINIGPRVDFLFLIDELVDYLYDGVQSWRAYFLMALDMCGVLTY